MKSDVSNRQIFFLLYLTLSTYTLISIPKVLAERAGTGAWVPILIMTAVFSLLVVLVVRLGNKFPGRMLFDYSQEIAGKFFGYVLSIFYALYFLLISVYLNVQLTNVLKAEFFPKTPDWAMLVAGVAVFGCMAYKGVNSVVRFIEVIGPVYLLTAISIHFVMLLQGDINNILPLFRPTEAMRYLAASKDTILSFLGIEILTIVPFAKHNEKKAAVTAFFTLLFIGFIYVLAVETSFMMLGINNVQNYNYSLIEAIKVVNIPVLERVEILYLTVGFFGLVAGVCVVYLALVEYVARLFSKVDRKFIVLVLGVFIITLGRIGQTAKDSNKFFDSVIPIIGMIAAFLIPALLLVIARVKGLGQKTK